MAPFYGIFVCVHYFLVLVDNRVLHLPDFKLRDGEKEFRIDQAFASAMLEMIPKNPVKYSPEAEKFAEIFLNELVGEFSPQTIRAVGKANGESFFMQRRRPPDKCRFTIPSGVGKASTCFVVDEAILVREIVFESVKSIDGARVADGTVLREYEAQHPVEAKTVVADKMRELKLCPIA